MCFLGVLAQPALSLLIKAVTSPSDPNLTLRERAGQTIFDARFGRGYYGATDSVLCSAEFQTTEETAWASGTAGQDHRVPKCSDKEVCLGIGEGTALAAVFTRPIDAVRP